MTGACPAAVVVVNYGSSALLREQLAGSGLTEAGLRVVVVDNRTTQAESEEVAALGAAHGWDVVLLPDNSGFGHGVNVGVERAAALGCRAVILLNPDAVLAPEVASALVEDVCREPRTLVSPRILRPDGTVWFAGAELLTDRGRTRAVRDGLPSGLPWLPGTCLAAHLDLWERLGGFDDRYFLYWEDVDLSVRCLEAGGRVVVRDDLEAVHAVGGTQDGGQDGGTGRSRRKSDLYYFYNCRNRLLFGAGHVPRRRLARWILGSPAYAREVLLRGGRRQFVESPGPALAALRGTAAGLRVAVPALVRGGSRTP